MFLRRGGPARATADAIRRMPSVRVGIVDVGANTLRLLVAMRDGGRVLAVHEDRVQLGLGEEIERTGGRIGAEKAGETAAIVRRHVRRARKLGCEFVEILVTSPGRQALNGEELVDALREAAGVPARVLAAREEGELAWRGAIAAASDPPEVVGVCDIGGGSTQLVVGTLSGGPAWSRSVDVGSLRLTRQLLASDPPTDDELARARAEVALRFTALAPPLPLAALATGGTARTLRRIAGSELGPEELQAGLRKLAKRSVREIGKDFGVDRSRARTLTAGTIILIEAQRRFGVPLGVARGGLREGAALALLDRPAEATA
jgi:exopolyphosphatase/guanosine-5'-triphosphate,3'-diphosphate pyrophosphatase